MVTQSSGSSRRRCELEDSRKAKAHGSRGWSLADGDNAIAPLRLDSCLTDRTPSLRHCYAEMSRKPLAAMSYAHAVLSPR